MHPTAHIQLSCDLHAYRNAESHWQTVQGLWCSTSSHNVMSCGSCCGEQVFGMTFIAFLIGLPMLKSEIAFDAVSSISVIGLYITYGLVIGFKLVLTRGCVAFCT